MRETMADCLDQFPSLFPGTHVAFEKSTSKFYLNGTINVILKAMALPWKEEYMCYCVEVDSDTVHITTPDKLYINKLDTQAAKLLFLKE